MSKFIADSGLAMVIAGLTIKIKIIFFYFTWAFYFIRALIKRREKKKKEIVLGSCWSIPWRKTGKKLHGYSLYIYITT